MNNLNKPRKKSVLVKVTPVSHSELTVINELPNTDNEPKVLLTLSQEIFLNQT